MFTKEEYEHRQATYTGFWRCSYEEWKAFYCPNCEKKDCPHRECYRRVPVSEGGLGLCPNLKGE